MKMRTTLSILAGLMLMSGGMLYAMSTLFSRDAQMRDASLDFAVEHQAQQGQSASSGRANAASNGEPQTEEEALAALNEAPSLDEWYSSAAGTVDEPFDPSPEEDDFFINDAEPSTELDEPDEFSEEDS